MAHTPVYEAGFQALFATRKGEYIAQRVGSEICPIDTKKIMEVKRITLHELKTKVRWVCSTVEIE